MPFFLISSPSSGNATQIQGRAVSATAPATGSILTWNGGSWLPGTGQTGATGPRGFDGAKFWSGTTGPLSGFGNSGDFFLDTNAGRLYGPKADGSWGSGVLLTAGQQGATGPTGAAGSNGSNGSAGATGVTGPTGSVGPSGVRGATLLAGTGAPINGVGLDGDWYIDTIGADFYGPKAGGVWGTPTIDLLAVTGPTGAASAVTGPTGAVGSTGPTGPAPASPVTSVAGRTGAVTITAADVSGLSTVATSGSASDLTTGTLATARLGSGTANATTFLRGDQTYAVPPGVAIVTPLAYAATVTTDASAGDIFDLTLTGNVTLANPTNAVNGKTLTWRILQDATGGRTVTLGNKFTPPPSAVTPLPFLTAANAVTVFSATYDSARDKWDIVLVPLAGSGNVAAGTEASIAGGVTNTASGQYTTISGGKSNTANANYSTVGGGVGNIASGLYATVCGGGGGGGKAGEVPNTASGAGSFVGGGAGNTASGDMSISLGGNSNSATSLYAAVLGGNYCVASTEYCATVAGGSFCTASEYCAGVLAGATNTASGNCSVVCGGSNNTASVFGAFVGGGSSNLASGSCAFVGGGLSNLASGENSSALGSYSLADRLAMHACASGAFVAAGDAQRVDFVLRRSTTSATPAELFLDGSSARLTIPSGKALFATVNVAGIINGGSKAAHYVRKVAIKNVGGTTALIGTVSTVGTDVEDDAAYDVAITADNTNDALIITVTGKAAETIRWVAHVEGVEIGYG